MLNKQKILFILMGHCLSAQATTLPLPATGDVVGEVQYIQSQPGETIDEVGKRYSAGYSEMVRANPKINPIQPLPGNIQLIVPSQFILPHVARKGIVINLAEYRLYYFPENENIVVTFPVGIGRKGWKTPLGITKVIGKEANPKWRPTAKLQAEALKNGDPLPDFFPSGPANPLGKYVLRLGWSTYLIHGTNRDNGIGERVSAGCIRMFPDDIEHLFSLVPVGTQVHVINEPVKIGTQDGVVFLQMYPLLGERRGAKLQSVLQKKLTGYDVNRWSHDKVIQNELSYPTGLVRKVSV